MSSIVGEPAFRKDTRPRSALLEHADVWLVVAVVLMLAVLVRHEVVANTDVAWGFTMAEKVLAGERPYVDFIEPNPPSYIYLHLPAVIIARGIGLSPELVMDWLVFIVIGGSVWLTGRILLRANLLERFDSAKLLALVTPIVAILPAQSFAQREHIAIVLFLPALAVTLVRVTGAKPSWSEIVVAGLGAGAMMVLKPHLALGLAATIAMAAWSARSWAVLVAVENWIAFAVIAAYVGAIALVYPEYLSETVPLLRVVYLPVRSSMWSLIISLPAAWIWAATLVALGLMRRSARYDRLYGILLAAAVGFSSSFFIQGKGWPYHSYPMLALALMALACAMSERRTQPSAVIERGGWAVVAGSLAAVTFIWMNVGAYQVALEAPIRAFKPHPTMLTIAQDLVIGHPLVRAVGGTWVGRNGCMWIRGGGLWRRAHGPFTPEEGAQIDRYVALDRAMLIDALRNRKPDVIILQKAPVNFAKWAQEDAEINDLLKPYRDLTATPEVLILRRDGS